MKVAFAEKSFFHPIQRMV